jgi:hypothetical protein
MKKILLATVALVSLGLYALPARADAWYYCKPTQVMELDSSRVHVACSNAITVNGNQVKFLAIGLSDKARVNRFISLASSALLSGKYFLAAIPVGAGTNVTGCAASNCRTPYRFGVAK